MRTMLLEMEEHSTFPQSCKKCMKIFCKIKKKKCSNN